MFDRIIVLSEFVLKLIFQWLQQTDFEFELHLQFDSCIYTNLIFSYNDMYINEREF